MQNEKVTSEAFEKIKEINLKTKFLMEILIKRLNTDIFIVEQKKFVILDKKKIKFEDSNTKFKEETKNKQQLTDISIKKSDGDIKAADHMKSKEYKEYSVLSETRRGYLSVITHNGTKAEKDDAAQKQMEYLYEAKSLHDKRIKLENLILDVKILDLEYKIKQLDRPRLKRE
jgi:hypothetical protein